MSDGTPNLAKLFNLAVEMSDRRGWLRERDLLSSESILRAAKSSCDREDHYRFTANMDRFLASCEQDNDLTPIGRRLVRRFCIERLNNNAHFEKSKTLSQKPLSEVWVILGLSLIHI